MDIKVGDYIRDKYGEIHIVYTIKQDTVYCDKPETENPPFDTYGCRYYENSADIVKHSPNPIDLVEDEDFVILEYKTPRYRERITRKFEVSKVENFINFENKHCSFLCKVGDKKIVDKICKNIKIKGIVTKENFKNVMYEV